MRSNELRWVILTPVVMMVLAATASAEGGRPSQTVLGEMGLGGLAVMSDDEAMSVRGHGFMNGSTVSVFGNSFATIDTPLGTSHSENGYAADGRHIAFGANYSEAGIQLNINGGGNGGRTLVRHKGSRWVGKGGNGGRPGGGGNDGGGNVARIKVFAGGFSVAGAH